MRLATTRWYRAELIDAARDADLQFSRCLTAICHCRARRFVISDPHRCRSGKPRDVVSCRRAVLVGSIEGAH
jgi:hypothetical protein